MAGQRRSGQPRSGHTPPTGVARFVDATSPEALFVISGIAQYTGATIAINLFDEVRSATVALLRVLSAALVLLVVSWPSVRRWTRREVLAAGLFGVATAFMNLFFYLAVDRVALGKSVVIEFIGPICVAAALTRTRRNTVALLLAVMGVVTLSGVEIDAQPLGLFYILCASALWAAYIVLGRRVAALDRGSSGLALGLLIGGLALAPVGIAGSAAAFSSARILLLGALVGVLSTVIGYGIDQAVMRRIPTRRFALLLALLPVTAMAVGFVALDQRPSALDLAGAALVIVGVVIQERDEVMSVEELPG